MDVHLILLKNCFSDVNSRENGYKILSLNVSSYSSPFKKQMTQSEINSVIVHILKNMHLPQLLRPEMKEEESSSRDNL